MPHDPKSKKVAAAIASKSAKDKKTAEVPELADEIITNYKHVVKRQDQS